MAKGLGAFGEPHVLAEIGDILTIHIIPSLCGAIGKSEGSLSVPFVLFPLTDVFFSIGKSVSALSMSFAVFELTDVFVSVGKSGSALAVMLVLFVLTDVFFSMAPSVSAKAVMPSCRCVRGTFGQCV